MSLAPIYPAWKSPEVLQSDQAPGKPAAFSKEPVTEDQAALFARVKDDGWAEAALIAVAGMLRGAE
jgi:hypothetical protein